MPTPNNNNSTTLLELALLAKDVYKENAENRGVNGWKPQKHGSLDKSSGLQIQNYQNDERPNHTVIAISGTNGLNDWDDNLSFVTGGLSE
ncbi:hypothetical protein AZO1586I_1834 [Bathymodiolus thermophilus thioautotrophic gill symbiont]|uniref:Uncharacterized protein n=1 Tax=Bathymodiolus thermophilus thioautotrophic gill symbiont TaxID=2360 RepID=A0ABM8M9V4_9GAMM|nr:hypothetical protein [Bathymodiolus thermophilus thioautotrophic gill symbiont]CAB5507407.1 hypothetical protein AZO1586I_1834 [Bathymodiolus thermophilus thioautotrophic gill symbiont]CAC9492858.1 hypothetical protein [uncultured Gammaproteobacteria bacterium]